MQKKHAIELPPTLVMPHPTNYRWFTTKNTQIYPSYFLSLDQEEPAIVQQLQILKYLIEIWPKSQETL